MVFIGSGKRQALPPRQLFGDDDDDGSIFDDLFGEGDEDEETTISGGSSSSTSSETSAAISSRTTSLSTSSPTPTIATPSTSVVVQTSTSTRELVTSESELPTSASEPDRLTIIPAPAVTEAVVTEVRQDTTSFVTITTSSQAVSLTPSNTAAPASAPAPAGFLENKPLAGAVFGVGGLIGLIIIVFLVTLFIRRTRRKKLVEDAVSFDPSNLVSHSPSDGLPGLHRSNSTEKGDYYGSENGHGGYGSSIGHDAGYVGGYAYPTYAPPSTYPAAGYNSNVYDQDIHRIPRVSPPPLLPHMTATSPIGGGDSIAAGGPPGISRAPSGKRASDNGSIMDNPYAGMQGYKVANV